jgi:[acyl-carrier-protein] S-malonyltransferase
VVNESITIEDSIKLLDVRSRAMQESMPVGTGGMAALIGKSLNEIDEILPELNRHGKVFIANDNANGQVVLSGEIRAINFICENYRDFKIKRAVKLPVSAPFHCELINSASKKLGNAMNNQKFDEFIFPLYSNVTAEQCDNSIIKDLLVRQVVSRVKWRESVENMIRDDINFFIEIGPGNILTNLIKRINKKVVAISISTVEDLEKIRLVNLNS